MVDDGGPKGSERDLVTMNGGTRVSTGDPVGPSSSIELTGFRVEDGPILSERVDRLLGEKYVPEFFTSMWAIWQDGCIIARRSDHLVGFLVGILTGTRSARILLFGIDPEIQGGGLGSRMLDNFINRARGESVRYIELELRMSNDAARAFYTSRGFLHMDVLTHYYSNGEDGHRMLRYV